MASFSLNIDQLETNLIISHSELVRQLEAEYMKRINGFLQQKAVILMDLQIQFLKQRQYIKQIGIEVGGNKFNNIRGGRVKIENDNSRSYLVECPIVVQSDYPMNTPSNILSTDDASSNIRMVSNSEIVNTNHPKISYDKKHKCPYCQYSTDKKSYLHVHIRTHTGEKPFKCSFGECTKRFVTKSDLTQHMKRHLGVKPYQCSQCNKAFVTNPELGKHIRTHTKAYHMNASIAKRNSEEKAN